MWAVRCNGSREYLRDKFPRHMGWLEMSRKRKGHRKVLNQDTNHLLAFRQVGSSRSERTTLTRHVRVSCQEGEDFRRRNNIPQDYGSCRPGFLRRIFYLLGWAGQGWGWQIIFLALLVALRTLHGMNYSRWSSGGRLLPFDGIR